ncbi:hypothetical protein [Listeria aquatica]|uniref:hypothetical protein n=1 Tax=Listeria aquatica TaxID=1494960 RepID=UPI0031F53F1A
MSGVMDIDYILHHPFDNFSIEAVTGGKTTLHGTPSDLYHLIRENKKNGVLLPELYQTCGTEDFLYEDNLAFRDFLKKKTSTRNTWKLLVNTTSSFGIKASRTYWSGSNV